MYKALFKYFLFAISSCVACISESVPRRLYQPVAALGFSSSCWEARTGWCAETRGLLWAHMWEIWSAPGHGQPGVHGGLCSSAPGFLDKMYERHKRRYSLCDISKVDRTVDVVLLKVWCLRALFYGFLSLTGWSVPCCTCPLSWVVPREGTGRRALALQHGDGFGCYQTISCQICIYANMQYPASQIISYGMQADALSESFLWPPSLSSAVKRSPPVLKLSPLAGGFTA